VAASCHKCQKILEAEYGLALNCTWGEPKPRPGHAICPGCKCEIDPEVCCCGDYIDHHSYHDNHSPVPMGCTCHYSNEKTDTVPFPSRPAGDGSKN
jgi:hypothetical protein